MTPAEFEDATGLSGYAAANLLRVSKSKWYEWRDGVRPLPRYVEQSMVAHVEAIRRGWKPG